MRKPHKIKEAAAVFTNFSPWIQTKSLKKLKNLVPFFSIYAVFLLFVFRQSLEKLLLLAVIMETKNGKIYVWVAQVENLHNNLDLYVIQV